MLVEMAVADAYAIAWEFTKDQTATNDLSDFHSHPSYIELKPGQYTDDTQRSIANANVLTRHHPANKFSPHFYAEEYLRVVRNDPREGYSRGYQAFLASVKSPDQFLTKISREKASNGSVMGVAPMGFLNTVEDVKLAAMIQAITTHHQSTVLHAQIVALAVHYFVHVQGTRSGLVDWLVNQLAGGNTDEMFAWSKAAEDYSHKVSFMKRTTIAAASISAYMAYAVTSYDSLSDIILDAVYRGGDTDSAAAVAVAVASCCPEIKNDIPQHLIDKMDQANPGFGVQFLNDLEQNLRNLP